jgi:beta-lactamase class A
VTDVRFDRDERHLQTEIGGLEWRPEFVDAEALDLAYAAVPEEKRDAAFRAYQKDPRDTATPRGMAKLLQSLAENRLLRIVYEATAGDHDPDGHVSRSLEGGVSPGWILAHKTGTSGTWRGVTAVTNDVGILMAPDQKAISLVVFIADSRADPADRAALIADMARMTIKKYR